MKMNVISILALLFFTACAQSPSAIAPVSMGDAYSNVSCSKARSMLVAEHNNLAVLSQRQNSAVAGDAVGVFLIGVPVSSLTGGDVAGSIATSKGKINALEARLTSCG